MTCSKCNTQNPEGAKFCWTCGAPLSTPNPPLWKRFLSEKPLKIFLIITVGILIILVGKVVFSKIAQKQKTATIPTAIVHNLNLAPTATPTEIPTPQPNEKVKREDLAVKLPQDVKEVTTVRGIKLMETPNRPLEKEEEDFLKRIINSLPEEFIEIGPKRIVSIKFSELVSFYIPLFGGSAYASGTNIFVDDRTFSKKVGYDDTYRLFVHEITHVAQYESVPEILPEKTRELYNNSLLVQDWAESMEWRNTSRIPKLYVWEIDEEKRPHYPYIAANLQPAEDMADGVSYYVMGRTDVLDQKRMDWIQNWLKKPSSHFAQGTIPIYPKSKAILTSEKSFDEEKLADYKTRFQYIDLDRWDVNYLREEDNPPRKVAEFFNREMVQRGWVGQLTLISGKRGETFQGELTYKTKSVLITIEPGYLEDKMSKIYTLRGENL